jgi:L-iditol 2-dehydrogenase
MLRKATGSWQFLAAVKGRRPQDLRIRSFTKRIGPREALAKVQCAGICGTDLRIYNNERAALPGGIGHECVAEVVEAGKQVTAVAPGDLFTLNPNDPARKGNILGYNGSGVLAEAFVLRQDVLESTERRIFRLSADFKPYLGVFIEPLACAVHFQSVIKSELFGKTVVVSGAGHTGLLHVLLAKAYGAKKVILINRSPQRLERAVRLGIAHKEEALLTDPKLLPHILSLTDGHGPEIVIIASAFPPLLPALEYVSAGGRIGLFVSTSPQDTIETINVHDLRLNEKSAEILWKGKRITLFGRYGAQERDFNTALELLSSGVIDVRKFVSHVVSLQALPDVMRRLSESNSLLGQTAGKVIVDMRLQGSSVFDILSTCLPNTT